MLFDADVCAQVTVAFGGWVLGLAPHERVELLQRLAKALDSAQGARLRGVQVHPCFSTICR